MDKTKEYIAQCDCPEIQGLFEGNDGDVTAYLSEWDVSGNPRRINTCWPFQAPIKDFIWLPRQDQLQEMVDLEPISLLLARFRGWFKNEVIHRKCLDSMEQLWLAFVMFELHGKKWDGREWI